MQIGNLHQKASRPLSVFVIGCCAITTFLLWSMESAAERIEDYYPPALYR